MATAQKLRSRVKQAASQWTCLFPNEIKTQQQSLVFVKRMMAVAVSSITYLRGIFPEDAYRNQYLEDLCIKVLREDSTCPGASKLLNGFCKICFNSTEPVIIFRMTGCFDALEKGYLQLVFIGVHTNPADPNSIIESYQFKFRYTPDGPQLDILSNKNVELKLTMKDTKKASVLLIRKLFLLMQNLDTLPNDVSLTVKLYYYDDVTPTDYQPPGFKEGECDSLWFEGTAVHIKVGELKSAFHVMKVQVTADEEKMERMQRENALKEDIGSSEKRKDSETKTKTKKLH